MSIYDEIEQKYGFKLPAEYLAMAQDGWLDPKKDYLEILESEWMSPEDIRDYEPADYHQTGYVPFAETGMGDHWAWWPAKDPQAVILCPHDMDTAEFESPNFTGFLFRRILEHAIMWTADMDEEEREEAIDQIRDANKRLKPYFPAEWTAAITALTQELKKLDEDDSLPEERYDELVQKYLSFPRMGEKFKWYTD